MLHDLGIEGDEPDARVEPVAKLGAEHVLERAIVLPTVPRVAEAHPRRRQGARADVARHDEDGVAKVGLLPLLSVSVPWSMIWSST